MKKIFITILCLSLTLPLYSAYAFSQYFEGAQLSNEITIISNDQELTVEIPAETFSDNLSVYLLEDNNPKLPNHLKPLGKVYLLWLVSDSNTYPNYKVKINYSEETNSYSAKDIYIWQNDNIWQKIESQINQGGKYVEAVLNNPSIKLGVFEAQNKTVFSSDENLISSDKSLEIYPPTDWTNNYSIIFKSYDHLYYPPNETYKRVSDIYEYDTKSETKLNINELINLKINYQNQNSQYKELFYWDNNYQDWIKLPSINYPSKQYLTTKVPFTFLRLAIFEKEGIEEGIASWYSYKNCLCAASRNYPKGTNLKVTNITEESNNYGKSVIVTVNDYGPEEWTKRIIDLDKIAFQQIANLKSGIMNVIIEQIND